MSIEVTTDEIKKKVSNNSIANQNNPNVLMELEDLQISSNYEIRPSLQNTFKISKVKEILQNVLQEFLGGNNFHHFFNLIILFYNSRQNKYQVVTLNILVIIK